MRQFISQCVVFSGFYTTLLAPFFHKHRHSQSALQTQSEPAHRTQFGHRVIAYARMMCVRAWAAYTQVFSDGRGGFARLNPDGVVDTEASYLPPTTKSAHTTPTPRTQPQTPLSQAPPPQQSRQPTTAKGSNGGRNGGRSWGAGWLRPRRESIDERVLAAAAAVGLGGDGAQEPGVTQADDTRTAFDQGAVPTSAPEPASMQRVETADGLSSAASSTQASEGAAEQAGPSAAPGVISRAQLAAVAARTGQPLEQLIADARSRGVTIPDE